MRTHFAAVSKRPKTGNRSLRTVPPNTGVILCGLLLCWESKILVRDIDIQKENWG